MKFKKYIIEIISLLMGIISGIFVTKKVMNLQLEKEKEYSDKHLRLFLMMNQWVKLRQEGKQLKNYFIEKGYKRISIYGMSYVAERLVEELKGKEIEVIYGIDKNANNLYSDTDIKIITLECELEEVDAIVITAITFLNEIKEELSKRIDCPLLSLEDIIYEV